jgi:hypothetical protein
MPEDTRHETATLLAPMVKKALWFVLNTPKVSSAEVEPTLRSICGT